MASPGNNTVLSSTPSPASPVCPGAPRRPRINPTDLGQYPDIVERLDYGLPPSDGEPGSPPKITAADYSINPEIINRVTKHLDF